MLDEPTNHLDMHSVELLIEALNKYEGSLILVSHDRYFISRTANVFWEIIDHQIREFRGTYEEYLLWKEKITLQAAEAKKLEETPVLKPVVVEPVKPAQPINKEIQKDYKNQQKIFEKAESLLQQLQEKMAGIEGQLSNPEVYAVKEKFVEAEKSYQTVKAEVARAQASYEIAFEKLMELEEQIKA
jgi:ATP-binding cassette subfamily F protein 3